MKKIFFFLFSAFILTSVAYAQIENVPLGNPVYEYLKEMQVKGITPGYDDATPNLSRYEVVDFLNKINSRRNELSKTEISLLERYRIEFDTKVQNEKNSFYFFKEKMSLGDRLSEAFSNKNKNLYEKSAKGANITIDFLGNLYLSKEIKPNINYNAAIMDGGFRGRGTLFDHLGYYLSFNKGVVIGQKETALLTLPILKADFKFNEDKESNLNYDFVNGYLKYHIEPIDNFNISLQFGREKITQGYGYGSKLQLSGDSPDMDFLKIDIGYGVLRYSFIHASTVGDFNPDISKRYTKYWATQKLTLAFEKLFNFSFGANVVYARPLEFAYLNPIIFWGLAEKSLQDRDNKNVILDFETTFLKNVQFQGTLFVDDDQQYAFVTGKSNINEKLAYQLGTLIYEPIGLNNLSLAIEYTKIRPYVYSHTDIKSDYTANGISLGHPIGPNADQIFSRITYNFNDWIKMGLEYSFSRKGNNIYDSTGALARNAGGNIKEPFRYDGVDDPNAVFLDGDRVNTNAFAATLRIIPIKNFLFTFKYYYQIDNQLSTGRKKETSYFYMWMNVDY